MMVNAEMQRDRTDRSAGTAQFGRFCGDFVARIVTGMVKDDAELFKQFMDKEDFRHWMTARVFEEASLRS